MVLYIRFGLGVNKPKSIRALAQSNPDCCEAILKDSPIEGSRELVPDQ